jgi:hypothetical protein
MCADRGKPLSPWLAATLRDAWADTRRDSTRDRLLLVEGLPCVPVSECEALVLALRRACAEYGKIWDAFLPLDAANNTRGYAFLEFTNSERVRRPD